MIRHRQRMASVRIARWSAHAAAHAASFAVSLALAATAALAGPNANGTLILHSTLIWGLPPECTNTFWECDCAPAIECEDADVQGAPGPSASEIWWVYAAFPPGSTPRVAQVAFGISFPQDWVVVYTSSDCASARESTPGFPTTSGSGTVLTFENPLSEEIFPVCSFWGYAYSESNPDPVEFALTPHPTVGGYFLDDSVPAEFDPIADYGRLGFGEHIGYLPCPMPPVPAEATSWGAVKQKFKATD